MDRTRDRRLIARLREAEHGAMEELARLYGPQIYQLAYRQMKNREDAEEVTQDVLMKVYRKIDDFRGDASLSSWIYRITFNTAMSRLRSRAARAASEDHRGERRLEQTPHHPEPVDTAELPDEAVMRAQLRRAVAAAIRELPEIYRAPLVLRDIQGLSAEEARARLKLKDQTLKSRLHRGRLMLRDRLRAFAGGLAMHRATPACC
jgi:RNA polymerase sigma-70 factor (ECF subfamily)